MSGPAASPFSLQHVYRWTIWMVGMSAVSSCVAIVGHLAQRIPLPGAWRILAGVALACCGPGLWVWLHVVTFKPWCADSHYRGSNDYGVTDASGGLCLGVLTFGWLFLFAEVVFGSRRGGISGVFVLLVGLSFIIYFGVLDLSPSDTTYNPRRVFTAAGASILACLGAWVVGLAADRLLMVAPTVAVALSGGGFGLVYAVGMLLGLPWSLSDSPQRKN